MMVQKIKFILLIFLVFLCTLTYHPSIIGDIEHIAEYNVLRLPMLGVFTLLMGFSMNLAPFKSDFIKRYCLIVIFILCEVLLFFALDLEIHKNFHISAEIQNLVMSIGYLFIGYNLTLSENQYKFIFNVFIIFSIYVGLQQVLKNVGGFVIEETYLATGKNVLGALLGISAITSIVFAFLSKYSLEKLLYIIASVVLLIILLTIRCRSAFFALICTVLMLFINYFHKANSLKKGIILLGIPIFFLGKYLITGIIISESVDNYIFQSLFLRSTSDITSGRTETYSAALSIIEESPFWGQLTTQRECAWVHNYILKIFTNYGVFGALPFVVLYFYLLRVVCFYVFKERNVDNRCIGFYQLFTLFIISLAEPTLPYGPGSVTLIAFILVGRGLSVCKKF